MVFTDPKHLTNWVLTDNEPALDEGKPTCERCKKSGYACAGYSTGLQFINTSTAPFNQPTSNQSSAPIQLVGNTPVRVVPRIRTAELPMELSLAAFQSEVCTAFMLHNFVWKTYGNGWLEPAAQELLDQLSTQAVRALSGIFFGIFHHKEDIQLQACLHYGKVLAQLRMRLAEPSGEGVERMIIPVLVLLMHAVSQLSLRVSKVVWFGLVYRGADGSCSHTKKIKRPQSRM